MNKTICLNCKTKFNKELFLFSYCPICKGNNLKSLIEEEQQTIKESCIFTKTELKELNRRLNGKKQNYKIWYVAKPKIKELIKVWLFEIPRLRELIK